MKSLALLCALSFPAVMFSASETDRAEIVYAPAEVSLQSVQTQFDATAGTISKQLTRAPKGSTITIQIVGGADQTGNSPDNDKIAASRAERVAATLAKRFPMATITPFSLSDDANERTVRIQWKITAPPPLPVVPRTPVRELRRIIVLVLVLGVLTIAFIIGAMLYTTAVVKKEGKKQIAAVIKQVTLIDRRNNRKLRVPIVPHEGGMFRLPARYQNGNPVVRASLRDATNACQLLLNSSWQEETDRLIASKEIEVEVLPG